jgi:hypothetical protein
MAIASAWLELVERDSFFVYWLNTLAPSHIDTDEYVESLKVKSNRTVAESDLLRLLDLLSKYKIKLHLLDTTTDIGVPAVCSVVEILNPTTNQKEYAIGASAGYNPAQQIVSATNEAIVVLRSIYGRALDILPSDYEPFSDPTLNIHKRINLYRTEENNNKFIFFLSSPKKISVRDWVGDIVLPNHDAVVGHLIKIFKEKSKKDKAFNVFVHKFTNDALKELSYHVVRVMCDGLYPIYLIERNGNPHHPRLKQFASFLGKEKEAVLNIWPHPFP